jgi:hypothetical protein
MFLVPLILNGVRSNEVIIELSVLVLAYNSLFNITVFSQALLLSLHFMFFVQFENSVAAARQRPIKSLSYLNILKEVIPGIGLTFEKPAVLHACKYKVRQIYTISCTRQASCNIVV